LLIRNRGEQRLSDFLLWECAFAELVFHAETLAGFHRRRFGSGRKGIREAGTHARRVGRMPSQANLNEQSRRRDHVRIHSAFRPRCGAFVPRHRADYWRQLSGPILWRCEALLFLRKTGSKCGVYDRHRVSHSSWRRIVREYRESFACRGWKYFCEIDCHIAYSVIGAQTAEVLGPEMQQIAARGKFIIVRMKTWFDERTISAHRGNGPLTPNPRKVVLVDDTGRRFERSAEGQAAFEGLGNASTALSASPAAG